MKFLLLSDIHGNFPALKAVAEYFSNTSFTAIFNCGDSIVYAPFPNETLHWLQSHNVHSILGNTDRKIKKLLKGKSFKKPGKQEKRIMYINTSEQMDERSKMYLLSLKKYFSFSAGNHKICLFHGSPEHTNEFLFPDTQIERFRELSAACTCSIIITGHSHVPYHKLIGTTHFINPGSCGRMFDANPAASCAVLTISDKSVEVRHYRIVWPVEQTVQALQKAGLPEIYQTMYQTGKKLN
ncbi:MAG TPA: metallophosphoesterase [Desulfobacterales bacterium]|nr:metallophosphoesterase [Desulfobacterales bacterium]HIP37947.1 metallophosphoesterase [Desulfocapsa sulfexigens]